MSDTDSVVTSAFRDTSGGNTEGSRGQAALLGAITTLVATLTLIATVNGEIARMFRNHKAATIVALALALLAILCGLLTQVRVRWLHNNLLLAVGSVALVGALAFAIFAEVESLALSDRPAVTSTIGLGGTTVSFKAHVLARKAKAHDQIVVTVYGIAPDGRRGSALYYAKSGPTTEGELVQDVDMLLDSHIYAGAYLSAVIVPEHIRPPNVDCNGDIVNDDGTLRTAPSADGTVEPVSFRPHGGPPLVGCLTITFPAPRD